MKTCSTQRASSLEESWQTAVTSLLLTPLNRGPRIFTSLRVQIRRPPKIQPSFFWRAAEDLRTRSIRLWESRRMGRAVKIYGALQMLIFKLSQLEGTGLVIVSRQLTELT